MIQYVFSGIMLVAVMVFLYMQKNLTVEQMQQLQFIGWLIGTDETAKYYLWFHTTKQIFKVSPITMPGSFYDLPSDQQIKHNLKMTFHNQKYTMILDK